jgi:hypothetical protein
MEKDPLKKFIDDHSEEWDVLKPSPDVWSRIAQNTARSEGKVRRFFASNGFRYGSIAASIAIVAGLYLVNKPAASNDMSALNSSVLIPRVIELEEYYLPQIIKKKRELVSIQPSSPDLVLDIEQSLLVLDEEYEQLKNELNEHPNDNRIMNAAIKNLQMRVRILNQQLDVFVRVKQNQKQQNDGKTSI